MEIYALDTPSLLIDLDILRRNLERMQAYACRNQVALRPHTKTHKCPEIAAMQMELGAQGITVAKVGEAEAMAEAGIRDIFIANEIVGDCKLRRIAALSGRAAVSFGVDAPVQAEAAERIFAANGQTARVLIEIEVGENRSGIIREKDFLTLLDTLAACPHVRLEGVFSHDGNSYTASSREECLEISQAAQQRTLQFAALARKQGFPIRTVSIGSTPSQANGAPILPGVTEIRPGTYALMDASQAHAVGGGLSVCAATVLASVISRPTAERVILDVGAKGLTMQRRTEGICATAGLGTILEYPNVHIDDVYDEHAIIYHKWFRDTVEIGGKVRIVPVHICPVCNLYDTAWLVQNGQVLRPLSIACRGKLQ